MAGGSITVLDGCGNDAGAEMSGGHLFVRGAAGARIGGGMEDGLIVVHGDVGPDPGAGMTGGRIVVNGRCPSPPWRCSSAAREKGTEGDQRPAGGRNHACSFRCSVFDGSRRFEH